MANGNSAKSSYRPWYRSPFPWLMTVAVAALAFVAGWFLPPPTAGTPSAPLRLSGYQFVSPLLACNISPTSSQLPQAKKFTNAIQAVFDEHSQAGDISKGSVFFIDYQQNFSASVNGDAQYYPSSIGKIPIMMAYYALAEHSSRDILNRSLFYPDGSPDMNASQDIKPAQAIQPGRSYSVDDLIGYMIKYSDNNATELLYENLEETAPATLQDIYSNLGIPIDYNPSIANLDFITPRQISILFRILYNATYLSNEDAEHALQLLSQSSFTQGLVAGVPRSTVVAHKLGLVGIDMPDGTKEHELHDCGIIYAPSHPYLLCVMTRGAGDLPAIEGTIADISRTAYQEVENGYK